MKKAVFAPFFAAGAFLAGCLASSESNPDADPKWTLSYPSPILDTAGFEVLYYPSGNYGGEHSFSIHPPLPAGLTLDTGYGTISGVPLAASPPTTYEITAWIDPGRLRTSLQLHFVEAPPASPAKLNLSLLVGAVNARALIPHKFVLTFVPLLPGEAVVRDTLTVGEAGYDTTGVPQMVTREISLAGPRSWSVVVMGFGAGGKVVNQDTFHVDRLGAGEERLDTARSFTRYFSTQIWAYFPDSIAAGTAPLSRKMQVTRFVLSEPTGVVLDSTLDPSRINPRALVFDYDYMTSTNFGEWYRVLRVYGNLEGWPAGTLLYEGKVGYGFATGIYQFILSWKGPATGAAVPGDVSGQVTEHQFFGDFNPGPIFP